MKSESDEEIYYEFAKLDDGIFADKRRKYDYNTETDRLQIRRKYDRI